MELRLPTTDSGGSNHTIGGCINHTESGPLCSYSRRRQIPAGSDIENMIGIDPYIGKHETIAIIIDEASRPLTWQPQVPMQDA